MKLEKGKWEYALPDDFDRICDSVPYLKELDHFVFARAQRGNQNLLGNPIFCEVIKGFETAPVNRLWIWPAPNLDGELVLDYWPIPKPKRV